MTKAIDKKTRIQLPKWASDYFEPSRYKVIYGGRGSGKALRFDTPIPTPDGWKLIGELKIGDDVFDSRGKPCSVTGVFPQGKKRMYRMDFDGGDSIYADADHLWVTIDHIWRANRNDRKNKLFADWDVENAPLTTLEIKDTLTYGIYNDLSHWIPLSLPLDLPDSDLPIDAYDLGLWLGNESIHDDKLDSNLELIDVLGNKHIPTLYLRASYQQRMALLNGLMDSESCMFMNFSNINKQLSLDVQELIDSLGMKTIFKTYGDNNSLRYEVLFEFDSRYRYRMVKNVVDTGEYAESVCISVDSDTHMFLAGKSFIPTHNTWTVAMLLVIMGSQKPLRIACAREFQVTLQESAKKTIEDAISRSGLNHFYNIQRSHIYGQNGTEFFFTGFEGSREAMRGWEAVDIVWVEEAQRMSWESREILYPSMRKPGSELWFTFNPKLRSDPVWQDFCSESARKGIIKKINYDQNDWFPDELEEERLTCLQTEPERYEHIWLGEPDDEGMTRKIMRYAELEQCIDLHKKLEDRGHNIDYSGRVHVGLDLADQGRDRNALVARRGPVVIKFESFSSLSISKTVEKANRWCEKYGASRLYYDAVGMGTNVRSDILRVRKIEYAATPVMAGAGVKGPDRRYTFKTKNKDFFARYNAQLAWNLKLRVQDSLKIMNGDDQVDPSTCLFIDKNAAPNLIPYLTQMAVPDYEYDIRDRIKLVKKPDNESSPDLFDSTCMAFAFDVRNGLRMQRNIL